MTVAQLKSPMPESNQLLKLSLLLQLEQRAREANLQELGFLMVNETLTLMAYQQAAFWQGDAVDGKLRAISGVAQPDNGAPYTLWLQQAMRVLRQHADADRFRTIGPADLPPAPAQEWAEWFPPYALWCPLVCNGLKGGVLLGRSEPWQEADIPLLNALFGSYAQCLALKELQGRPGRLRQYWLPRRRKLACNIALAVLLIACFPVRVSVLAPAEIVPANPAPIRAPFDGVIATIDVEPNAPVHAGQVLMRFETTELKAKSDMAARALEMAQAQYDATVQEAMNDPQAKAKITMLQSKIGQQKAELDYNRTLLAHADITAPIDGVAVFDDPVNWIGKPVSTGERVMLVAPPQDEALEIQVPVSDVVTFKPGAEVLFFSNLAPASPVKAELSFASYSSQMTPEGVLAYPFRATLKKGEGAQRLGIKGTAKIYGERKPLALWLLRRPIALIRQWLVI